jgi:uncharacterized RDD family membrane protein YckC
VRSTPNPSKLRNAPRRHALRRPADPFLHTPYADPPTRFSPRPRRYVSPLTAVNLSASISCDHSMTWYYGVDGRREGPIEEANLETLELSGAIEWSTPVWRQGMSEWKPFGEMFNRASVRCHECHRNVDQESAVHYRDLFICPGCKTLYFQKVREGLASEETAHYGGFWIRFSARLLDGLFLLIVRGPLMVINAVFVQMHPLPVPGGMGGLENTAQLGTFLTLEAAYLLLGMILSLAYEVFFVGRFGGTPGKLLLHLRIVRSDFSRVTYSRAAIRFFGLLISDLTMYIGYIMVAFDPQRRALHDYIADTRVIKRDRLTEKS